MTSAVETLIYETREGGYKARVRVNDEQVYTRPCYSRFRCLLEIDAVLRKMERKEP